VTEEESFGLRVVVLARTPWLPISKEDFLEFRRAKSLLVDTLGLEENLHLVLGNYFEYEAGLLTEALRQLVFRVGSWSEGAGSIHEVNRRVVNLLSAGRGYQDQAAHLLSRRFGKRSKELDAFSGWRSAEYDGRLGYRAMEALRNYSQHRGLAVHHLRHTMWRSKPGGISRNALVPGISPKRLAEDRGFKVGVLRELQEQGEDPMDLRPLIREYVAGLATVHKKLRDSLAADVAAADERILSAIERYRREGQPEVVGLAAVKRDGRGLRVDGVDDVELFDDLITRRRDLVRQTRMAEFLGHGHYTTNEPKREEEAPS
jgi:hypothetical protein